MSRLSRFLRLTHDTELFIIGSDEKLVGNDPGSPGSGNTGPAILA